MKISFNNRLLALAEMPLAPARARAPRLDTYAWTGAKSPQDATSLIPYPSETRRLLLEKMHSRAKGASEAAASRLNTKLQQHGRSTRAAEHLRNFVKSAPLLINFHVEAVEALRNDPVLKNAFELTELAEARGESPLWPMKDFRIRAEERLFGSDSAGQYTLAAKDRPYYGTLGVYNARRGAGAYGSVVIQLKDCIRPFVSVTAADSFMGNSEVGTLAGGLDHVLCGLDDLRANFGCPNMLARLLAVSEGQHDMCEASDEGTYLEAQFHVPLDLRTAAASLWMNRDTCTEEDFEGTRALAASLKIPLIWKSLYATTEELTDSMGKFFYRRWQVDNWFDFQGKSVFFFKDDAKGMTYVGDTTCQNDQRDQALYGLVLGGNDVAGFRVHGDKTVFLRKALGHEILDYRFERRQSDHLHDTSTLGPGHWQICAMNQAGAADQYDVLYKRTPKPATHGTVTMPAGDNPLETLQNAHDQAKLQGQVVGFSHNDSHVTAHYVTAYVVPDEGETRQKES